MKKVYIETTIPSFIITKPSRDISILSHQEVTRDWWDNYRKQFELYVSQAVINEITLGDRNLAQKRIDIVKGLTVLQFNDNIFELGSKYLKKLNFPEKILGDAFHIAFAVFYKMDFLLTWNCAHPAIANTRIKLAELNLQLGYKTPDICTPEELMGGD